MATYKDGVFISTEEEEANKRKAMPVGTSANLYGGGEIGPSTNKRKAMPVGTSANLYGGGEIGPSTYNPSTTPILPPTGSSIPIKNTFKTKKTTQSTQNNDITALKDQITALQNQVNTNTTNQSKSVQDALNAYNKKIEDNKAIDTKNYVDSQTRYINDLANAQKSGITNSLKTTFEKQKQAMENQKGSINQNYQAALEYLKNNRAETMPTYTQNINTINNKALQDQKALAERMAYYGNLNSGDMVRNNINLLTSAQNAKNQQYTNQSNYLRDMATKESNLQAEQLNNLNNLANNLALLEQQYPQQLAEQIAGVDAQTAQMLRQLQSEGMNFNMKNYEYQNQLAQQGLQNALNGLNMQSNLNTTALNNALNQARTNSELKTQDLNNALNQAKATGYYFPDINVDTSSVQWAASLPGGFQQAIDEAKATPDKEDDKLIPLFEAGRQQRLNSDPKLREDFGQKYMTPEYKQSLQNQEDSKVLKEYQIKLNNLNLEKAKLEVEAEKAQRDINTPEGQAYYRSIQQKLDLADAQIKEVNSRIAENQAQASKYYSSTGAKTNSQENDYYNNFISEADGYDGEALYKNLSSNKDKYIQAMGPDNYAKAIKYSQSSYYNHLIDYWRGEYEGLKKELKRIPDYYKEVLGQVNYNKLMNLND